MDGWRRSALVLILPCNPTNKKKNGLLSDIQQQQRHTHMDGGLDWMSSSVSEGLARVCSALVGGRASRFDEGDASPFLRLISGPPLLICYLSRKLDGHIYI